MDGLPVSRRHALLGLAAVPTLAAAEPTRAAHGVLERLIGRRAKHFRLQVTPGADATYAYDARGGQVTVTGSTPIATLRGAYAYLGDLGLAHTSWEGQRVALPARLPDGHSGPVTSPFRQRVYMNTCTFGYTTPFWDWPRWRREIDWMALHGIDMPLAMEGQEWVWRALWLEEGLSAAELEAYFSGPAFAPWQRMGNIEGYQAPLPLSYIVKKRDLQKRILGAMRDLGMEPILPAFAGYVPKAFAERHPGARIYRMRAWEGFHETYWLDPADPLFARLAARFLDIYDATYGKGRYYLADAFNEMLPPIGDGPVEGDYGDSTANKDKVAQVDPAVKAERLAGYGKLLHDSIRVARPGAVWVMQGWLFGADQAFWTGDAIAAFLRDVPDDGLMVLDIGNDRYPQVRKTAEAFHGKGWIYGYVHNYGASNPVYGDLGFYQRDIATITADPARGRLQGFGVFPEGLDSNSIVYDRLYDLAWGPDRSQSAWLASYTRARYGFSSPDMVAAWLDIAKGTYSIRYWTPRWWRSTAGAYLLCKRPDIAMAEFEGAPGDRMALQAGVTRLSQLATGRDSLLLRHDLIELTRHLASLRLDDLIRTALIAYRGGDLTAGDSAVTQVKALTQSVDALMGAQPWHLAGWIAEARAYGDTPAEQAYYERNARAQVTVWGGKGNLHDYASKAWQGLYRDFYLPRWIRLFDAVRTGPFDQVRFTDDLIAWENAWVDSNEPVIRRVPSNPVGDAARLLAALKA
jgi:alpha-N-acetylglucosaminidase